MSRSFRALVRFFFLQFFQVESAPNEGGISATAVLALLASPGFIMSVVLFAKYSSFLRWFQRNFNFDREVASEPDKYTFIALSMAVTGLVVILRWESMFPDRRDFMNLAPLPLSATKVLAARIVALTGFMLLFLVTTNICSTFLFPMVVMEREGTTSEVLRFIGAHFITVTSAGLFSFCACLAMTGLMMALLPYGLFRRVKRYVQFAAVALLLLLFLSASGMNGSIKAIRTGHETLAVWLPVTWFLGLYQVLQGKAVGSFGHLAELALPSLAVSCLLAAGAYGLTYRWFYLRTSETVEGSAAAFPVPGWLLRFGGVLLPRSGFYRGTFAFVLRTIGRSDRHTAALASIVGLGLALAVQSANFSVRSEPIPVGQLAATLMLVYSIVTGLRLCFGIPSDIPANWVFRLASDEATVQPERVLRTVMYLFVSVPIIVSVVLFAWLYGVAPALMHGIFSSAAAALLIDGITAGFRVIPFTCAWLPGRENLPYTLSLFLAGMAAFSHGLAGLDLFLMHDPPRLAVYLTITTAAFVWLRRARSEEHEPMVWSDTRGEFDLLRISE